MKKYRLIKIYPDSPELGTEIEQNERGHYCYGVDCISKKQVEEFPEFWEEVVEKDYEVLSYKSNVSDEIYEKHANGNFTVPAWICQSGLQINSVKRLCDEIVFSVGDSVNVPQPTRDFYKKDDYTISSFKVSREYYKDDKLRALIENGCHIPIDELSHRTKPIFTTEDGVDIHTGDKYHVVDEDLQYGDIWTSQGLQDKIHDNRVKYFSTKEAAEKYISENKPMYTLKDIERCVENWGMCKVEKEHIKEFLDNSDK